SRGAYQRLFQSREVAKEYEAVAPWRDDLPLPHVHRSRLEPGESHFIMMETGGEPNSETRIELIDRRGSLAHYRLLPTTGRKHQLRAHMSALGIPICNDNFYPRWQPPSTEDDYSRPLQLLARAVEFVDPFSRQHRRVESRRALQEEMRVSLKGISSHGAATARTWDQISLAGCRWMRRWTSVKRMGASVSSRSSRHSTIWTL